MLISEGNCHTFDKGCGGGILDAALGWYPLEGVMGSLYPQARGSFMFQRDK